MPTRYGYSENTICQTMDDEHCVIAVVSSEVAKFRTAADKRRYNVFLICPVVMLNDGAKIRTFSLSEKKNISPTVKYWGVSRVVGVFRII